jgi:hypothetical protein
MKKRHLIYAFMAGLLLSGAICVRIMSVVTLSVDCAKVVKQGDQHATIMFYHDNSERYYVVRVPAVDLKNDFADVTATLWYPNGQLSPDALFGESPLELAKDLFVADWSRPDGQLQR